VGSRAGQKQPFPWRKDTPLGAQICGVWSLAFHCVRAPKAPFTSNLACMEKAALASLDTLALEGAQWFSQEGSNVGGALTIPGP
jgi:hypothetical protein